MAYIRGLLDRIILVVSIIAAGCIPSFIVQYRQRVGGMLDQVLKDLEPFQTIARQHHGGSLADLIMHHRSSSDPTFNNEGQAIQYMVESAEKLAYAQQHLAGDLFQQISFLITRVDPAIAKATWSSFIPAFGFSTESIIFAAVVGLTIWSVFMFIWLSFSKLFRVLAARH